jgi:vitamin B12 transporter
MKSFVGLYSLAFVIFLGFAPRVRAQSQSAATLAGTVTDPRGAAVANAQVSAELIAAPVAAGPARSAAETKHISTTSDGRFMLSLEPGRYRVSILRESFAAANQEITLSSGESRELEIRLELEPLSDKVVVTAQSIPVNAESATAPVSILTRTDIEQRAATSLPDLLATLPGISMDRTGAEGGVASLFIDGGNSDFTKVLVDGVPVNEPGDAVDFSNFTTDNIEKIEVVHGAESALYGSDAVSGVVQIFTARGTTQQPVFTAFAEGGTFSTGRGGATLSGMAGRFDYSAGASYLETQGQGVNDFFLNRTLSGNFGWRLTDSASIRLTLRDNTSDAGIPGQTLLTPPMLDDHNGRHDFSSGLRVNFSTGSHWQHQLIASESYHHELFSNPLADFYLTSDPSCGGPLSAQAVPSTLFCDYTYVTHNEYNRAGFEGQSSYVSAKVGLTAGYEREVENGSLDDIGFHVRRDNQAGFLDGRWMPVSRLTLSAGARAEDNANFGTRVVPRVGAVYALRIADGVFGDTRLNISYGQGIKEPSLDQSFGTDPCFPGNPNLLPEQSRTVDAGFEQKLYSNRIHITANYFDNRYKDIVSFGTTDPATGCGTYFNTDLARARGGNFSGEARITPWLSATANYSYDPTRVLAAPNAYDPTELAGNRLLRRPVNSGNALLNAAFHRMNWSLSGYFTGQRTDSDFLGLGITSNPGYARFDAAASYIISRNVSLYGRIANLANKQYQEAVGYPALGREFRIGMKYTTRRE